MDEGEKEGEKKEEEVGGGTTALEARHDNDLLLALKDWDRFGV